MDQLLERHFAGASLREQADEHGVSHQTIATQIRDLKREHVTEKAMQLLVARKKGEVLWLVVPSTSGSELAPWLRYLAWLVEELEELTLRVKLSVQEKPDGLALGLEDQSPIGG